MKKLIFFISITSLLFSCDKELSNTISYTISPENLNGNNQLKILLKTAAEADGETILLFNNNAWGQDSLHNIIGSMKLINAEAVITKNRDSNWIEIKHPKDLMQLEFEYVLEQDTPDIITTDNSYRPIIQPEYFNMFSLQSFMLPKAKMDKYEEDFNVTIIWKDFPKDYVLINSFGRSTKGEAFVQNIENLSKTDFEEAIFVGGDFRIHTLDIDGNEVVFAIRGDWKTFDDTTMVSVLKKTVKAQRDFYQDHSQPYYLVTMIPTKAEFERASSYQGTGLTNSFALSATNNEFQEFEGLVYLLNHELQHNWTGKLIKNDNEEEQYWFSEGFTEYYTLKNIATNNINGLGGSYFIKKINDFQREYFANPHKEVPNSEINFENFWSTRTFSRVPYLRGARFAFYLDQKIKQDSNGRQSLDDLLFQIKADAEAYGQNITHDYFIKTANDFLKEDIAPFFNAHIEQGKPIDLGQMYSQFGFEFEPTAKVFDLGFTFTEDNSSIATIDTSSQAYKAGLRMGDRITSRSYYHSADYEAEITVLENGKAKHNKFFPAKVVLLPQLLDNKLNKLKLID